MLSFVLRCVASQFVMAVICCVRVSSPIGQQQQQRPPVNRICPAVPGFF